jgi:hypothetical protein
MFIDNSIFPECNYITHNARLYRREEERALSIVKNNRERIKKKEEGRAHEHIIEEVISLSAHPPTQPRCTPERLYITKNEKDKMKRNE